MPKLEIANNNRYGHRKIEEMSHWDRWDTRMPDVKDQLRAFNLHNKSVAVSKSNSMRILGEIFKVITVDKSAVEYNRKFSELTVQIHKIDISYNQTVQSIYLYHSVKTAQILLEKLKKLSVQIFELINQAISLTIDYRTK